MAANKIFDSNNSQRRWVEEMKNSFQARNYISQADFSIPYCVFRVPEGFTKTIPEAYAPRKIGLGPYHHLRPELHKMQKQKLSSVREAQTEDKLVYVDQVVSALKDIEPMVRAFYDQYLDLDSDTLAWIVGVDGLFMLRYLKRALENTMGSDGDWRKTDNLIGDIFMLENQIPSILLKIIGVVYRCCLVEEDSIELHQAYVEYLVEGAFLALCQKYSPLKLSNQWTLVKEPTQIHLLHRMYHLIVGNTTKTADDSWDGVLCDGAPRGFDLLEDSHFTGYIDLPCTADDIERNSGNVDSELERVFPLAAHLSIPVRQLKIERHKSLAHLLNHMYHTIDKKRSEERKSTESSASNINNVKQLLHKVLNAQGQLVSRMYLVGTNLVTRRASVSKSFNVAMSKDKMNPTTPNERESSESSTMENLQKIPVLLRGLGVSSAGTADRFISLMGLVPWDKVTNMQGPEGQRLKFEQIKIPSASDMSKVLKITFEMVSCGIQGVIFKKKERELHLPTISLTTHSEAIIRNLLAYEAATTKTDSLLNLAQYIDMMCGMINTKDDIDIMKKAGIIKGNLSPKEILGIFNGVRKTTGKSEAELEGEVDSNSARDGESESNIGKAIAEINKLYDDALRVKATKTFRECLSVGMKFANKIVMVIVMVLLLMQTFCPGLTCTSWYARRSANLQLYSDH